MIYLYSDKKFISKGYKILDHNDADFNSGTIRYIFKDAEL